MTGAYALSKLKTVNYFRLLAYCYPFRIRDKHSNVTSNFVPGANFSEVIKLYEFDRYLRLAVMDAIERVEVYIRTLMTDHLGHHVRYFRAYRIVEFSCSV